MSKDDSVRITLAFSHKVFRIAKVSTLLIVSAFEILAACSREESDTQTKRDSWNMPGPAVSAPNAPELPKEAFDAYQAARRAVRVGDMSEAKRQLSIAVEIKSDFTEAWYNLGATNSHLALEEIRLGKEQEALSLFREAVENKKKAQELINEGKWFVYKTPAEQEQVKSDLANGLKDIDEVLADERSLIIALKIWAGAM